MAGNTSEIKDGAPQNIVGFEDDALKILERLDGKPKHLDVISIVGMPGIGKTTLALKVYNHPYVKHNFYVRKWITISQVYNKRDLLFGILRSTHIEDTIEDTIEEEQTIEEDTDAIEEDTKLDLNGMTDEKLKEQVYKSLKGKRYLIVLDDIWNIQAWYDLEKSFPDDKNVSRIIFTSRMREVALRANSIPHDMRLLSSHESWDLLQEKVFKKERCPCPSELMQIGKNIAEKCLGLPLVVVTIGGLLAKTEKTIQWWMNVCESIKSYLASDSNQVITKTLELSYNHLPDHLKPLFLYFAAFPEDDEVSVPKLIWLWIAEGFIYMEKTSGRVEETTVEDVAEGYLMDLIERSLIIISSRCFNGRVKSCRIHDLLHDLCLRKAEEESFMQIILDDLCLRTADEESLMQIIRRRFDHLFSISTSSSSSSTSPFENKFNRLAISCNCFYFPSERYPTICSLLVLDKFQLKSQIHLQHFKLLRVLDLGSTFVFSSSFSEIGQLVHLRYLALGDCYLLDFPPPIYKLKNVGNCFLLDLPSSIYKLNNLETLISKYWRTSVDKDLSQLKKLRHLHIAPSFILNDWDYSKVLPNLQTMSFPFFLDDNSCTIFRSTPNLRKLSCFCSEYGIHPLLRELVFLVKLEKLRMCLLPEKLRMSLLPKNTYACLLDLPASLKRITLSQFCTDWEEISKLARLPNLEKLKLVDMRFTGKLWDTSLLESSFQPFPKLKFLKFDQLFSFEQWNASVDHFPSLERLVLIKCYELKKIPSDLGDIPTLKTIEVNQCSHSLDCSAREILEEQRDNGNEQLEIFIYPLRFER